jgi:hypothetical protein
MSEPEKCRLHVRAYGGSGMVLSTGAWEVHERSNRILATIQVYNIGNGVRSSLPYGSEPPKLGARQIFRALAPYGLNQYTSYIL